MFNIKINFCMCLKVICEIIVNFCCVSRRILRLNMCIEIITYQKQKHQKMLVFHLKGHDKWHPEKMAFRVVDIQFHSYGVSTKIRPFSLGTNSDRRFPTIWSRKLQKTGVPLDTCFCKTTILVLRFYLENLRDKC